MVIDDKNFLIFDGGMGTMLQKFGLKRGESPELLNLTAPEVVRKVHRLYVEAGADVITSNTFGANVLKLKEKTLVDEVITKGIELARGAGAKYVAMDISSTGVMFSPIGTMTFERAYDIYKDMVLCASKAGADLILIETMSDLAETKAALLAAKENSDLPVIVSMTYAENGRTFLGTDPVTATVNLCAWGADAVGVNCSLGPKETLKPLAEILKYSTVPVICQPNAGIPRIIDGETVYGVGVEEYVDAMLTAADEGATILGGCCGTTPEYIRALTQALKGRSTRIRKIADYSAVASATKTVFLGEGLTVVGERINPTGKKLLQQAIKDKNYRYILDEAISQQNNRADILDVNVGVPSVDEKATLKEVTALLMQTTELPLQIDTSDAEAMSAVVRSYVGKPIINSVNGKESSLVSVLPIAKKYGAAVIGLTIDENGVPEGAEGRIAIAEKIIARAKEYGIKEEDIIIDCLALTLSTDSSGATDTLQAIKELKKKYRIKTALGISNISFGLPNREILNGSFLAMAIGAGLDIAIVNPLNESMRKVIACADIMSGRDGGAAEYIARYGGESAEKPRVLNNEDTLEDIIIYGKKGLVEEAVTSLLKTRSPMEIINGDFIPALNRVGEKFDKGIIYLPQLISSAETVKTGFDVVRAFASEQGASGEEKGTILLATVYGDVHDIGKNIVKMLLGSYGYRIIDMGKDVEPEAIVDKVKESKVRLVGLSALMTTTVTSMERTIKLLKAETDCAIMVGGAVLNAEYADNIGADFYAKDANESVKIANKFFNL